MFDSQFKLYVNKLAEIIQREIPNCKIILFGSRARGKYSQGADIDCALDTGFSIDRKILFKIMQQIEDSTIPLKVDLVDLNNISDDLKKEIKKEGRLWKI